MKKPMKPLIAKCEDGSTLFEWIDKDMRFGIALEKDLKESCWYFIAKETSNRPMMNECGDLPEELIRIIKESK
jgi:hypothetical protein